MQTMTKDSALKKSNCAQAFDEACDAMRRGDGETATKIISRAYPKTQAQHIMESIFAHYALHPAA